MPQDSVVEQRYTLRETTPPDRWQIQVYIVTGGNTGVGKETARILYSKNARVYVAGRSADKSRSAIEEIREAYPSSTGLIDFIYLDLADLTTISATAEAFLARETRLDVLINNAGVGFLDRAQETKQGFELQFGVNAIGHFALVRLLTPVLCETARTAPRDSVRVVWVSSSAAEGLSPQALMSSLDRIKDLYISRQYFCSKVGNYLHAVEFAAMYRDAGIVSLSANPGNLDSDLWRDLPRLLYAFLRSTFFYPSVYGAYTELFCACSPDVTLEKSGSHVAPWGRFWSDRISKDMTDAAKSKEQGGSGIAHDFWKWCSEKVDPFLPENHQRTVQTS
ncbi:Short-chain dehydrogenase [Geosmithia morbida]|uniref:Short-chain dehydrogenase n=1 Tax=Geosmithia morbida TaxID=1094350 RepID=A0A9P5D7P9_9HYPO|nr:Short-chain dehydrogenase [Geosmithia morbida]KAF4124729.1 Short-chain dehydrogenase [Geosmithia morbida]